VPEGLEAALGAALGDACTASLDETAATFFRALPACDEVLPAPDGARRFDTLVQAPPALARILSACVLIPPELDGDAIQPTLPPGMVAVTRDGACWRWDGHIVRAGAPNAAATRLRQSNRLHAIERAQAAALAEAEAARARAEAAGRDEAVARQFESEARESLAAAEKALRAAREQSARLAAQTAQAEARRASLLPMAARLSAERAAAATAMAEAGARHAGCRGQPCRSRATRHGGRRLRGSGAHRPHGGPHSARRQAGRSHPPARLGA
jgi:chromosome segregation protein